MNQLRGKKVLVTGGSGFIGSHLSRSLVGHGAEVIITTKYNSLVDNVRMIDIWRQLTVIEADLRNADSLRQILAIKPDIVFHLAAYNHVGDSFIHVSEALDCNSKGTANILEACEDYERFVYVSTSEVYGYQDKVPFTECMNPCPISPYAVGKYAGELYARMHMDRLDKRIVVVRPFNAYGPYQSDRAVIAEVIMTCLQGEPVFATEGVQTRDFNFVENLVDGLILCATSEEAIGQIINIGSGEERTIRELVEEIHRQTDGKSELHFGALDYRPTEIWRMVASNEKAANILNWKSRIGFEEGLTLTVSWFRKYLEQYQSENSRLRSLSTFNGDMIPGE